MGYRAFDEDTTLDEARESAEFTEAALAAYSDAELQALGKSLDKLLAEADSLAIAIRGARRQLVRANAYVRVGDALSDDLIRELVKDVLAAVRQDRTADLFVAVFPTNPGDIVAMSLAPELEELVRIKAVLAADPTPASLRKQWSKPLDEVIARGQSALADRKRATAAQSEAYDKVTRWVERVDRQRRAIDGALTTYAANKHLSRDFNDRFFPGTPGRSKRDKRSPVPPTP